MRKTKILLSRNLLDADKKYIQEGLMKRVGDRFYLVSPGKFDEDGICKEITDADVLLGPFITENILKKAVNLKLIQIPWTGMDTFNFDAIMNSKVNLCNSHSNAEMVAEFGLALILDLIKKISYHDRKMRYGNWNRENKPLDLKSGLLSSKTVCILGYGNIGSRIGKLIYAFGAKVIAVDNRGSNFYELSKMYDGLNWLDAITQADICVCTLPLTPETEKKINAHIIKKLKKECLLINISRAEIVDEDALFQALLNGNIGGFASDVWWNTPQRGESESYVSTHNRFEELDNVILSPHRAGFIEDALPHLDDAIKNIANLIEGKPLINLVDVTARY